MLMPMVMLGVTEEHRLGDGLDHPAGDVLRLVQVDEVLQQHRELVATEPGDRVRAADAAAQAIGHGQQHVIAADMAQLVVHRLEAVDVREQHRHACRAALDPGQRMVESIGEQGPIGESRQPIVECLPAQLLMQTGILESHRGLRSEAGREGQVRLTEPAVHHG